MGEESGMTIIYDISRQEKDKPKTIEDSRT
ncbi:MAG: hypothetical protein Ta2D_13830 [Rickettsiales bacterium]|nr:MAG: hypothetical protein Ta2D_13830 [Rickettsiales bacterium]